MRRIWVLLFAVLALTAMLLTACGGSGDRTKVEASLRHYLSTVDPQACLGSLVCEQGAWPTGAGVPQLRAKSCKKTHTGTWSCLITFPPGKTALHVTVGVKGSGEVYSAAPVGAALPAATVYQGGPGQSLP